MIIAIHLNIFIMNEEDEEIIKKLMNMLGNGREIKFKSANGQIIRVAY